MFIPPSYPVATVFNEDKLDTVCECMCGHKVPLRGGIACYTHKLGSDDHGWFLACNPACMIGNLCEGSA